MSQQQVKLFVNGLRHRGCDVNYLCQDGRFERISIVRPDNTLEVIVIEDFGVLGIGIYSDVVGSLDIDDYVEHYSSTEAMNRDVI